MIKNNLFSIIVKHTLNWPTNKYVNDVNDMCVIAAFQLY